MVASIFAKNLASSVTSLNKLKEFPWVISRNFEIDKKGISGILEATGGNA